MKNILLLLNITFLIIVLIWLMNDGGWEALAAVIAAISTLLAQLFIKSNPINKNTLKQQGGKGSSNYQSAKDININIKNDKK